MRLIDADALKEKLSSLSVIITGLRSGKGVLSEFMEEYRKSILRIIDEQATIDPESLRPQGEWSECDWVEYDGHGECLHYPKAALRCSNCCNAFKKELLWKDNYCPNCGTRMTGKEEISMDNKYYYVVEDNDFCSEGERREDDG